MPRFKASLLYFVIVLGTGFALGVVRVPFLVPRLGERYAELLEMPIMLVVIVLAARHVVRRFELPPNLTVRLQVGFTALALSVAAELLLAVVLQSQSLGEYIASRDPVSGSVYVLLLLVFALMPYLLTRVGIRRDTAGGSMSLSRLVPMQPVAKLATSLDFYEKLGFVVETRNDEWGWALLRCGGCQLMLDQSINLHPGIPRIAVLYLYPENLSDFHRSAREKGLTVPEIESTFYGMTEFRIEDPDGNRLWIGQANQGSTDA